MAKTVELVECVRDVASVVRLAVVEQMCVLAGVLRDLRSIDARCLAVIDELDLQEGRPRKARAKRAVRPAAETPPKV